MTDDIIDYDAMFPICRDCDGLGYVGNTDAELVFCPTCNGSGWVLDTEDWEWFED